MANLRANNLTGTGGRNAIDGSVFFDGSTSYLESPSSSDFAYGTGDFTWEAWVLLARGQATGYIFDHGNDGGTLQYASNKVRYYNSTTGNSGALYDDGGSIDYDGWHHLAVARSSGTTKLFVNGLQKASASDSHNYSAQLLTIGDYGANTGTNKWKGYLSNLRILKGTAVYTAAFTPPTEKLTAIDGTVLLCCQDSDNPLQEATGKTITGYGRYYADTGELFTDTGFNETTGWTGTGAGGWTTTGNGVATHAQGTAGNLTQSISNLVVGQTYKLEVDVVTSDDDVAYFYIEELSPSARALGNASNAYVGHYEHYFQATATTHIVGFRGSSLFNGTITNLRLQSYGIGLNPKMPKDIPPYGVDAGNIFDGAISMNSSSWMYFPTGRTEEKGRGRGVIMGGYLSPTGYLQDIYYVEIQSMGNAIQFGDLTESRYSGGGCGSSTRGLIGGGRKSNGDRINVIESIEFAITSNSIDFGDLTSGRAFNPGGGNQTRGIWMGGSSPTTLDSIEYVTIASKGDAIDFGNLRAASYAPATAASPTRMLAMGGGNPSSFFDYIDFVEIATTGNAQDFGDLTQDRNQNTGVSSNTRAVAMGGARSPAISNVMDFVTIATTGNATDFGDTISTYEHTGSVNNSIRGVICGARTPSYVNILESITIATTGNSTDFGDIPITGIGYVVGASDSHGGLS